PRRQLCFFFPYTTLFRSFALALLIYGLNKIDPDELKDRAGALYAFLREKWHFDELYDAVFVRPAVALGYGSARFDKRSAPADQRSEEHTSELQSPDQLVC